MKILVVLLLCSCVFGVPLGEQEAALAELLQKVLEADPGENDIIIDKTQKQDTPTTLDNVLETENNAINSTELPADKVDITSKPADEPNSEKPLTLIGEIILDTIPEEEASENEPVTNIPEDTKPLTGTLIVDEIMEDEDGELDSPKKEPNDEQTEEPLSYDRLDVPFRIPLTRGGLGWINKPSDRFKLFKPFNRDYDHFTILENPFSSPLDTLPMNPEFFESTTNADYDSPSQDYPSYDNLYDDDQTPKVTSNDSVVENLDPKIPNDLEITPNENEEIQDPNGDVLGDENDQANMEDPSVLPINENPDADISEQQSTDNDYPPISNTDVVSSSDSNSPVPFYPDRYMNDMQGDINYENDQIPNYPLDNHPNFENYPPHRLGNDMERETDFTRFNSRGPFHPHYYDSYDKYINVGDIKHFSPYMFYPKRHDGYDLFFRPPFERVNRQKIIVNPMEVMEPQHDAEITYKDDNEPINNERLPEYNFEGNVDETNADIDNNNDDGYVDNENTDMVNEPNDNSFSEQETSQDAYNEFYDNKPEWNSPHSVLNTDFSSMDQASPVETHSSMIEVPHYYFNGYPYYGNQDINNKRDDSMYLLNGLVRDIGDDSRFRRIHQYRNPYNRNDGPIIVFVGPSPNQNDENTLKTNQVDTESEDPFINSEGTLLTDIKHNVDIPYSPRYHPAFYTDRDLYGNKDDNDDGFPYEETQSFTPVDTPVLNHPYNGMVVSYPFPSNNFFRKYYTRNLYNNRRVYRNADYYEDLNKPHRYYRREPREFMNDYAYY